MFFFKLSYFIPRRTFWCCGVLCTTSSSTWKYVKTNKALWFHLNPRFFSEKLRIQGLFPSASAKAFGTVLRWAERGSIFLSFHNWNLLSWASWTFRLLSVLCIHCSWGSYIWTSSLLLPVPPLPWDSGREPEVMLKWCESFLSVGEEKWTRK